MKKYLDLDTIEDIITKEKSDATSVALDTLSFFEHAAEDETERKKDDAEKYGGGRVVVLYGASTVGAVVTENRIPINNQVYRNYLVLVTLSQSQPLLDQCICKYGKATDTKYKQDMIYNYRNFRSWDICKNDLSCTNFI